MYTYRHTYDIGFADNGFTVRQPEIGSFEVVEDDGSYRMLGKKIGGDIAGDIESAETVILATLAGCIIKGFRVAVSIEPIRKEEVSDGEEQ